jgi:hypothetical protein
MTVTDLRLGDRVVRAVGGTSWPGTVRATPFLIDGAMHVAVAFDGGSAAVVPVDARLTIEAPK